MSDTKMDTCSVCGTVVPFPVGLHHNEEECELVVSRLGYHRVQGKCPHGCGDTLELNQHGQVSCGHVDCPDPHTVQSVLDHHWQAGGGIPAEGPEPLPKGMSPNWDVKYHKEQYERELVREGERRKACYGEGIDPANDLEYLKIQNDAYYHYCAYVRHRAEQIAHATRDWKTRNLGKQYGKASETIRVLRMEVAMLRTEHGRGQWDGTFEKLQDQLERERAAVSRQGDSIGRLRAELDRLREGGEI